MHKKTVLENGLRVITIPQVGNLATTVLVLVETGSKYETKETSGIAHFLEHMCFKGTKTRATAMDIAGELDALGASYNAFTGHEYTGYYAKVETHKSDQALDIVADLYLNPVFKAEEIEKEKGVIIQELNMYEDMPQRKIGDYFMDLLYGDQPAGWDIGGNKTVIRSMNRDHFVEFRKDHYVAGATTVIIAGGFDEEKMLAKAKELFKEMPTGKKGGKPAVHEVQSKPSVMLKHKEVDQTHIMIGVRAFSLDDPRKYTLEVMASILGGGMSSRLFHKVREELGAAYYVRCSTDLFTDHGYIAATAGVEHNKLEIVIQTILAEFKRLTIEPVSKEELDRVKGHLSGTLLLGLETSDSLAVFYGTQEILKNEVTPPDELLQKINAVTAKEIQDLAKEIFTEEKLNLALIGPHKEKKVFESLLHL